MYLKSIELHGFKSFANKIVLEFHNGITGIVGPNGSGKSNISDAVRWVLGEQSAKQLRGASMQDVIFAGTENRKPLSFSYVAITMDNSDHLLPIEYDEVTVARRVYRSGESEYLLNGTPCRLKDVNELFYDTGIGKEGYSIIGQGQIERILSGKPEERRELFDEAAGIVKSKKRKAAAQKQLDQEQENLVRVNDILGELERQVGPLERQAQTAKEYLKKKEELKTLDVNMFLIEIERLTKELQEITDNATVAQNQLAETNEENEKIKASYASLEEEIERMDEKIESIRKNQNESTLAKGKLETQIQLLEGQIKMAESSDENLEMRRGAILAEQEEHLEEKDKYVKEKEELEALLEEAVTRLQKAKDYFQNIENEINRCNSGIETNQKEIMDLLNKKATIKSEEQKFNTMFEQTNIRKAQLNQRLLARKTEEDAYSIAESKAKEEFDNVTKELEDLKKKESSMQSDVVSFRNKLKDANISSFNKQKELTQKQSRLESLKNIAERYDGYGNAIKKVMDQKSSNKGLLGVVADLIHVDKKYETAIETALGGNIQNIVTEDEETAKKMISYLKQNHFGRATFLPLTAVDGRGNFKKKEVLNDKGVIGLANELIECDSKYDGVIAYLVGRVVVVDHIDNAIALARRNNYSLHIVTLEGEYLSPGGSMAGGSFKNKGNLLSRNREIEQLETQIQDMEKEVSELKNRQEELETAIALHTDDLKELQGEISEKALSQNTAKLNYERALAQKEESLKVAETLHEEGADIERQIQSIEASKKQIVLDMEEAEQRETQLKDEITKFQEILDEQTYMETSANRTVAEVQVEEASARQKVTFVDENLSRIENELSKDQKDLADLDQQSENAKVDAQRKRNDIESIKATISAADDTFRELEEELKASLSKKEEMSKSYKGFFDKKEEISKEISRLEKEIYRLDTQREKAQDAIEYQNNYMWNEYELTLHAAMELKNPEYNNGEEMKKTIAGLRDDIRRMGNVNVNAIEEFKEISERYTFLKTQHDDLIESKDRLTGIIDELDKGMREQFAQRFEDIKREFDKAFKDLFGGGKGSLELVEGEDILETGIKIIAQPPGKKLQNMMQLSGGEKSLTAIALLFAIQNLKPSPFCLLDEIEAALDDSNVDRFAKYLNKLTKNTQFIIITHRRGTMTAADRLYGITMQEKGISTLVSVNLIENDLED
ncbi:MAG: chromosome segregation protein SMC [Lachnospiraceae bacterium]|nr:chromosome segregation protein SMC [Lachnospiraceae bacterium]